MNLEEAIPQLSSSLKILVHPIKCVHDMKSRRGQYTEIATHMQILAQQSRNEIAMAKTATKALLDFVPEDGASEKLAFKRGDEIEIMLEDAELESDGWCKARIKGSTRIGLAPLDYLEKATSLLAQVAETTTKFNLKEMEKSSAGTQSNPRTMPQVPQQDSGGLGAVVGALIGTYYGIQSSSVTVPRIQHQSSGSSGVATSPYGATQSNAQMGPQIQYQSSGSSGVVTSPDAGTQSNAQTGPRIQYQSFGGPISPYAGTQSNYQTRPQTPPQDSAGHDAFNSQYGEMQPNSHRNPWIGSSQYENPDRVQTLPYGEFHPL
jgi:hypothetical protein